MLQLCSWLDRLELGAVTCLSLTVGLVTRDVLKHLGTCIGRASMFRKLSLTFDPDEVEEGDEEDANLPWRGLLDLPLEIGVTYSFRLEDEPAFDKTVPRFRELVKALKDKGFVVDVRNTKSLVLKCGSDTE